MLTLGPNEDLEVQAPDTVRFTRALKAAVPLEDRVDLLQALWSVAISDGDRNADEGFDVAFEDLSHGHLNQLNPEYFQYFDKLIEIANAHDIPVIVDGAAQLPPVENLWKFTQAGASAAGSKVNAADRNISEMFGKSQEGRF